jgi:hypothetical protein
MARAQAQRAGQRLRGIGRGGERRRHVDHQYRVVLGIGHQRFDRRSVAVAVGIDLLPSIEGLPELRPEDAQYFGKLLAEVDEDELTLEEAKERRIMKLLLKVKNGTPQQRKSALRTLGDKARQLGYSGHLQESEQRLPSTGR